MDGASSCVGRTASCGDGARHAAGQRFKHDVAEGVGLRWKDEEVHIGVALRQVLAALHAHKVSGLQLLPETGLFVAVAHDEEAGVGHSRGKQGLLDVHEQGDILLNGQPAHITKNNRVVRGGAGAPRGREQIRIHAAPHHVAGPVRPAADRRRHPGGDRAGRG